MVNRVSGCMKEMRKDSIGIKSSENNSAIGEEVYSYSSCTGLNVGGVMVEEFPRVEIRRRRTEIVGRLGVGVVGVNKNNVESFQLAGAATQTANELEKEEEEEEEGDEKEVDECLSRDRRDIKISKSYLNNNNRKIGRFSIFGWFKRENCSNERRDIIEFPNYFDENKPRCSKTPKNHLRGGELRPKTIYSSSGSVETTCSTATVHSFTFRSGNDIIACRRRAGRLKNFRKHSSADDFAVEGTSCVNRCQFDSEPFINRDEDEEPNGFRPVTISGEPEVRGGYGVAGISGGNLIQNKTGGAELKSLDFYRSLPTAGKTADLTNKNKKRYSHVRGKRPAPKPPVIDKSEPSNPPGPGKDEKTNTYRRKRRAPEPPVNIKSEPPVETKTCPSPGIRELADNRKSSLIANDTLKLEGGILLPRKSTDSSKFAMNNQAVGKRPEGPENGVKKGPGNSQVVLPRPWYKRSNTTLSERDISGSFRREVLKIPTLSKSPRDNKSSSSRFSFYQDNNQHQVNPGEGNSNNHDHRHQSSSSNTSELNSFDKSLSRLNHLFSRSDHISKAIRKEDKRKSNLSILTNISELDREAAAIVQREQARNQALAKSHNSPNNELSQSSRSSSGDIISEMVSGSIEPQRRGTRALISKFNAISNITKVTVNATTFFAKSSTGNQSAGKIDVVRSSDRINDRNFVTKRLVCDGEEKISETGNDVSSINFFRRLEAAASRIPENSSTPAAPGWEEKIKRYFPEAPKTGVSRQDKSVNHTSRGTDIIGKNYSPKHREQGNLNLERSFEAHDVTRNTGKIEHLSRADLKEMLIEMKHSLPKRPKPKSNSGVKPLQAAANGQKIATNSGKIDLELTESLLPTAVKVTSDSNQLGKFESSRSKSDSKEKVTDAGMKAKVSSAAQTSANLRKLDVKNAREKQQQQQQQQRIAYAPRVKSGVKIAEDTRISPETRVKKGPANSATPALARNNFQLIRPRDFACIEAMKTDKGAGDLGALRQSQNTYMNVIEDSIYANAVINPENNPGLKENKTVIDKINVEGTQDGHLKTIPNHNAPVVGFQIPTENISRDFRLREEVKSRRPGVEKTGGGREPKAGEDTNMNTIAINRLLRKLEGAIASGQHQQAAGLAKELAQLKIHCSVVRQRSGSDKPSDFINVDMYIEDKLAHQGPIPLQLSVKMTVAELKNKVFAEFDIPADVQRWIIGKNLADNDNFTINELKAVDKSSIFLYLVAPDLQNEESAQAEKPAVKEAVIEEEEEEEQQQQQREEENREEEEEEEREEVIEAAVDEEPIEIVPVLEEEAKITEVTPPEEPTVEELKLKRYEHLMSLENSDVIPNSVPIECPICFAAYGPCEGVILRDCLHMFCRTCIANTIMYCEEAEVKCPFRDSEYTCESTLQEREIKALVTPEIYEQHLAKSVSQAENNAGNNAFHCKTPDCRGWCIYDDNVNVFLCPVCGVNNCLTCQAIHTNKNCREYQDEIRLLKETDQETKRTAAVLEEMVESGEALACPTCAVVLMKKWGCDWLRCSMCKTEICWVTRGPRWGPAGKGDTSGGCKCGENGVKCHPRCNYCH